MGDMGLGTTIISEKKRTSHNGEIFYRKDKVKKKTIPVTGRECL
jgi:hypothetical protein